MSIATLGLATGSSRIAEAGPAERQGTGNPIAPVGQSRGEAIRRAGLQPRRPIGRQLGHEVGHAGRQDLPVPSTVSAGASLLTRTHMG